MKGGSGWQRKPSILVGLILAGSLLVVGLWKSVFVVEIGGSNILVPVAEGDVFLHTYVDSMYQEPVTEKFRIEQGFFRLVHVATSNDAVLAYLGIEGRDEPNVDRKLKEFTIPAASIGRHVAWLHGRPFPLGAHGAREGNIHVRLLKVPLLVHVATCMWR